MAVSRRKKFLPVCWIALTTLVLVGDYATGPFIQFPILFLIPITPATWYSGRRWGIALAIIMPLARLYYYSLWELPWTLAVESVNTSIQIAVLTIFALLVHRTASHTRTLETKVAERTAALANANKDLQAEAAERMRGERALRQSEERYRLMFDGNPQPMWVFDLESLGFLAVNDTAIRVYGYSREEFLSMTLKDIRSPEDVPALLHHFSKRPGPGIHRGRIWKHRKKDGSILATGAGHQRPGNFLCNAYFASLTVHLRTCSRCPSSNGLIR